MEIWYNFLVTQECDHLRFELQFLKVFQQDFQSYGYISLHSG